MPFPATPLLLRAPEARAVCVAGSFNDWHPNATPLHPSFEGYWSVDLELPPGTYEYRFVVDGAWLSDPDAIETVPNGFGTFNAVLRISAP